MTFLNYFLDKFCPALTCKTNKTDIGLALTSAGLVVSFRVDQEACELPLDCCN